MDKCKERQRQLVVTGCDSAEDLEFIEKALDQMALFVSVKIAWPGVGAVFSGRDGVPSLLLCDIFPNVLGAISLVAQNVASGDLQFREQINGRTCIMYLTASDQKSDRIAQSIYDSMDFCGLSTPAGSDKLVVFRIYSPFFAPALCGCALMDVLSIHRFSKSASAFSS